MSGDFIRIKGVINRIDQKSNPGSFDQREYYKAKGIYYQISGKVRGKIWKKACYIYCPQKKQGFFRP